MAPGADDFLLAMALFVWGTLAFLLAIQVLSALCGMVEVVWRWATGTLAP